MEIYNVTVWNAGRKKPENWEMESPPVEVVALDSYEAARIVAGRAGITKLHGVARPKGFEGLFFNAPRTGLVFQSESTHILKPIYRKRESA